MMFQSLNTLVFFVNGKEVSSKKKLSFTCFLLVTFGFLPYFLKECFSNTIKITQVYKN